MYTTLRYVGLGRRRITWNSMGECFCYVLNPGELVDIPSSQVNNAKATAQLKDVSNNQKRTKVKKIRTIIETESSEVITESDEDVFTVQDKLDPFSDVEIDDETVDIIIDEEVEVEEPEEKNINTDFTTYNKKELTEVLINDNKELKEYILLKERRDTLIGMCVEVEASS